MHFRFLHLGFVGCVLLSVPGFAAAEVELKLIPSTNSVGRFGVAEFRLDGVGEHTDPFDPAVVDVRLEIESGGSSWSVPAFFAQDYERQRFDGRDWFYPRGLPGWKVRFAPPQIGDFSAVAVVRDAGGTRQSEPVRFICVASTNHGFLRVSDKDPRWLEFSDGQPFFPIGQNLAFIGSQQYVTVSKAETIFGKLAANGANYLRIWTGCDDWALAIESRKSAWGRSWERRARVVAMPGEPGRNCVLLTNSVVEVQPSHDLALRPATKYLLTGRARVAGGASLRLEVQGTTSANLAPPTPETWAPFRYEFSTDANDHWLAGLRFKREGGGSAWLADLSLKEAGGGPELLWEADVNRPVRGYYNPLDCFWLDELVRSAQQNGVYLQVCLLARDLYMSALKDPASPAYDRAIADAKKTFRYAVARWGAFTGVAAWEYWNEMDPGLPTDRFYTELGEYLEQTDPYRHLRTTSTWGPSPKDCRHPKLDFADVHFYLRPADKNRLLDEVEGVLDRAKWLREQAPDKPAHQGESGLADDQWRITDEMKRTRELVDFHNMLWASALSGTTGTAMPWWWERLDEWDNYPDYRPLSRFIADVPWNGGEVGAFTGETAQGAVRVVGLRTKSQAWVWFFHRAAAWKYIVTEKRTPTAVTGATFDLDDFPAGGCPVEWWDTRTGEVLGKASVQPDQGRLVLAAPEFTHDLACRVGR